MALPDAVKKQAEKADELIKQATANTGNTPAQDSKQDEVESGTPEQKQTPPADNAPIDFEQKFKVLQGKYNSELPALRDKVKSLEAHIQQLQATPQNTQVVDDLKAKLKDRDQQLEQLKQQQAESTTKLNEHLKNEYGEEFAQAVAQTAKEVSGNEIAQLKQTINEMQSSFQNTQESFAQNSRSQQLTTLKGMLKAEHSIDLDAVESDPLFQSWLADQDPRSGQQIGTLLHQAFNSGDLQRTARFYIDYNANQPRKRTNPLNEFADPVNTTSSMDSVNNQSEFSPNAFKQLTNDFMARRITREEYERKERELFNSMAASKR